jgi:hypothetical protein
MHILEKTLSSRAINHLQGRWLRLTVSLLIIVTVEPLAHAGIVSRFSVATGELYSDNIFFSQKKEDDFVTLLAPTLSLVYKPSGYPEPTFNMSLSSPAEIFAQHSDLNNIGDNLSFNSNYIYHYSPRLDFTFTDRLLRHGESRTGGLGTQNGGGISGLGGLGGGGRGGVGGGLGNIGGLGDFGSSVGLGGGGASSCGRVSAFGRSNGVSQGSGDLVTTGEWLENQVGGDIKFKYSNSLSFRGGYCWESSWFLSGGGTETSHSFSIGGEYKFRPQHTLSVRYTVSLLRSRNGQDDLVHDFDFGDGFLGGFLGEVIPTEKEIHLTPTLSIRALIGLAVRTPRGGSGGNSSGSSFGVEPKLDLELIKLWRTASLILGVNQGLTGSLGVSGPSFTTEFFTRFSWQLSQRLALSTGAEFAMFDADQADFNTFQAFLGLQYWLTDWLSTNLAYSYSWSESTGGTLAQDALGSGKVESNTVFLSCAVHFDVWPQFGLAKEGSGSIFGPALRSPSRSSSGRSFP